MSEGMKTAKADWSCLISLDAQCPHCGQEQDVKEQFEYLDIHPGDSFSEDADMYEATCENKDCGKVFLVECDGGL